MKVGVLLMAFFVLAVGGIYLYQANIDPFNPLQTLKKDEETNFRKAAPLTPTARPVEAPKRAPGSYSSPVAEAAASAGSETAPKAAMPKVPSAPPRPFPLVDQIEAGSRDEAITAKYGSPAVSLLTSNSGHVFEIFVYTRDRGHSATVIQLEDGKVASAHTSGSPVPALGLSAPRRWPSQ